MLSLLGDFGQDNPHNVLSYIITEVQQTAKGELEIEQRKNQLRILIQLRKLVFTNIKIMDSVRTFFKEEEDFLYLIGEEKGIEKGKKEGIEEGKMESRLEFVQNLLVEFETLPVAKIASLAGVSEDFVLKVKKTLK